MALRMASPYLHPMTHVYWFRRAVPEALRPRVGKTILSISLGTKDAALAKARFLEVALDVQKKWDALKRGIKLDMAVAPKPLSNMQRQGLAGEFHRWLVSKHEDDPGAAAAWRERIERDRRVMRPSGQRPSGAVGLYLDQVRAFLDEREIMVDDNDLFDLSMAAAEAGVQAKERACQVG